VKLGSKRMLPVLLCALLLLTLILPGCSREEGGSPEETTAAATETTLPDVNSKGNYETVTLRVLMESEDMYPKKDPRLESMIAAFEAANKGVKVEIEYLPFSKYKRPDAINELREKLELGGGPDVFLLSNASNREEDLFPDVNKAMRNGQFLDLRTFFDADMDLNKGALNQTIMDAGVVDGARYVLPLKYNMPVLYYVPELAEKAGFPTDLLCSDVEKLMDNLLWWDDPEATTPLIFSPNWCGLDCLADVADYDTGEVFITAEEIAALMEKFKQMSDWQQDHYEEYAVNYGAGFDAYTCGRHWVELERYIDIGMISSAVENAAVCKAMGYTMEMIPLTGEDGAAVAEVTEYGAINSTTENQELAYQFLRMFLSEEVQWEKNPSYSAFSERPSSGYCVRTVGSAKEILLYKWEKAKAITTIYADFDGTVYSLPEAELEYRNSQIEALELTDADVPILDVPIGEARFPIGDFAYQFGWRYNRECVDHPDELNWDAVADQYIRDLQDYMMAE